MDSEGIADNLVLFVWEPALVKINMIASATEAACLVLSVDETVKNPGPEQEQQRGRGRGRGRR